MNNNIEEQKKLSWSSARENTHAAWKRTLSRETAYLSMTGIFIRRGNFAYDPMKGFWDLQGLKRCSVHGIIYVAVYISTLPFYRYGV